MTRTEVVIQARKLMELSQSHLAESIGVSAKAVQSYEQGWRTVPNRFFSQLFVMLAELRNPTLGTNPCWSQKDCDLKTCRSHHSETGCCCWMLSADRCLMMTSDESNPVADFLSCPVLTRLLSK